MNKDQLISNIKEMIQADTEHLVEALELGNRVHAHRFVDAIVNKCRELEDLTGTRPEITTVQPQIQS